MYTLEELKVLGGFLMFSLIGRILFYREKHGGFTFKEKVKCRFVSWLWEIPVLLFFGFSGLAIMERWDLSFTEAGLLSMALAYIGLESIKIWIYDWFNARWNDEHKYERFLKDRQYPNKEYSDNDRK